MDAVNTVSIAVGVVGLFISITGLFISSLSVMLWGSDQFLQSRMLMGQVHDKANVLQSTYDLDITKHISYEIIAFIRLHYDEIRLVLTDNGWFAKFNKIINDLYYVASSDRSRYFLEPMVKGGYSPAEYLLNRKQGTGYFANKAFMPEGMTDYFKIFFDDDEESLNDLTDFVKVYYLDRREIWNLLWNVSASYKIKSPVNMAFSILRFTWDVNK
jgi:hypothetical protein